MIVAKVNTARLSVVSNTLLIILKLTAGIISGSVSIISEAIHSCMDLVASLIAFFSVRVSDNPPDSQHPYGHGKFENISGVIEGLLILVAAFWIIMEAVKKLIGEKHDFEFIWIGAIVMFISAGVNTFVSHRLYKTARETNSLALEADALHLKTDVFTSLGVATGLIIILISGIKWLDPVIAILIALLIIKESISLISRAFLPLTDAAWPNKEVKELENILRQMNVDYHDLRTRIAGNYRFVDFHIRIPGNETVGNSHDYCDMIEGRLTGIYDNLSVTIHVEPI